MKKILALAIGVLLVAMAVPALAESPIDFSGHYRLLHVNHNNYQRFPSEADYEDSESFFAHRLQIQAVFHATEDIDVTWNFRAPSWTRWGALGVGGAGGFQSRAFFATIRQPWGTVQVGRLVDGSPGTVGGLATLGHGPEWGPFGYTNSIFNFNDLVDGITYNHDFGNGFGLAAYYFKMDQTTYEPYDLTDLNLEDTPVKDGDRDRFGIEPRYTWDGGGFTLGFIYERDRSGTTSSRIKPYTANLTAATFTDSTAWEDIAVDYNAAVPVVYQLAIAANQNVDLIVVDSIEKNWTFIVNPAFTQTWGPFSIGFEAAFAWSKTTFLRSITPDDPFYPTVIERFNVDNKGYGLYFDAIYNYGAGDISFLFWLVDGTSWADIQGSAADELSLHNAISLGDFAPFLVAYGYNSVGRGYEGPLNTYAWGNGNLLDDAINPGGTNQWGVGLLGNHSFTDDISINWGIGYFALVEAAPTFSKDLGWEIDLGLNINLLDNLTFSTQFGYFFNGNAYDWPVGGGAWIDAKDTYAWVNYLNVAF